MNDIYTNARFFLCHYCEQPAMNAEEWSLHMNIHDLQLGHAMYFVILEEEEP